MSVDVMNLRRAISEYLLSERRLDSLHEISAAAFADIPATTADAEVINYVYGLMTDCHAGLLSEPELQEHLRSQLTFYMLSWPVMGEPSQVVAGTQDRITSPPVQRPSLRVFETQHEAVSA